MGLKRPRRVVQRRDRARLVSNGTVVVSFQSDFSIPANLDCGDVDAATSSPFNFNYPSCQATATAWGFSAQGRSVTLRAPTDSTTSVHVATETQITIKIGSNATYQRQGAHWITNPSTPGVYAISVGGTFAGWGTILVAIVQPVQLSATVAETLTFTVSSIGAVSCTADDGATITAKDTTGTSVPFGTMSANAFCQGCQDLQVSTNAANGYTITGQENTALMTSGGKTIPDTACDSGPCTEQTGAGWSNATHNGFGHTCNNQTGHDCGSAYTNGTAFRQFANIAAGKTAQALMASSTPATATGRLKYRLSVGQGQSAGTYTNLVTLIVTPQY